MYMISQVILLAFLCFFDFLDRPIFKVSHFVKIYMLRLRASDLGIGVSIMHEMGRLLNLI